MAQFGALYFPFDITIAGTNYLLTEHLTNISVGLNLPLFSVFRGVILDPVMVPIVNSGPNLAKDETIENIQ